MTNYLKNNAFKLRSWLVGILYLGLLSAAYWLAWELRFDFTVPERMAEDRLLWMLPMVMVKMALLMVLRQFDSMLSYFSLPDLLRIVLAMVVASVLAFLVTLGLKANGTLLPRGVLLADLFLSVAALCSFRVLLRIYRERRIPGVRTKEECARQRVAILGAGDVGANLARELLGGRNHGLMPVVFIDDDVKKQGTYVHSLPVVGPVEGVDNIRERFEFDRVILAMPSASERRLREVVELLTGKGIRADIVPSMGDLTSGRMTVSRIRPVDVTDLLGRKVAELDTGGIRHMIRDRVVLVTGAGGSIGSELCRQIVACNPTRLLLLEQSEGALFVIEQELVAAGMGSVIQPLVGDILDRPRLEQIFKRYRPQIVFHAAAHKHVYLMERQPAEALKNNSLGTLGLAEEAIAHEVEAFVFISTDKAINPTSVMGASKRLAELLLRNLHRTGRAGHTKIMAVRFGNVLGSSGSVVPIFKQQIERGGPVTVTHPDVTRYFMTIPEAVGLVLQSSLLGSGGEIFVLDMGPPVKIADLARQMILLSGFQPGVDIEIVFTGLKPGEKLYEELQHRTEEHQPTSHPQVMKFVTKEDDLKSLEADLRALLNTVHKMEPGVVKEWINRHIREYQPYRD